MTSLMSRLAEELRRTRCSLRWCGSPGASGAGAARRRRAARRRGAGRVHLLFEAIREGYLLHYGDPRLLDGADPDLRLLAGDYLYAVGLERLAALGDLEAVRELGT